MNEFEEDPAPGERTEADAFVDGHDARLHILQLGDLLLGLGQLGCKWEEGGARG